MRIEKNENTNEISHFEKFSKPSIAAKWLTDDKQLSLFYAKEHNKFTAGAWAVATAIWGAVYGIAAALAGGAGRGKGRQELSLREISIAEISESELAELNVQDLLYFRIEK